VRLTHVAELALIQVQGPFKTWNPVVSLNHITQHTYLTQRDQTSSRSSSSALRSGRQMNEGNVQCEPVDELFNQLFQDYASSWWACQRVWDLFQWELEEKFNAFSQNVIRFMDGDLKFDFP
jgi:hypothetical protein